MLRTVSFSASGQEQGIDQYIPPHLRNMFYKNPAAIHASHNGLDPYGFSTDGLVLYLPLWALKGSAFKSVDDYKHTCVTTDTLWKPNGLDFDGDSAWIDCGKGASLDINLNTLEVWINPDTIPGGNAEIVNKGATGDYYLIRMTAGYLQGIWQGLVLTTITDDTTALTTTWQHCVAVWDGTNKILYRNSVAIKTAGTSGTVDVNTHKVNIGCYGDGTGNWFDGLMGEVRIYNRALSAGEITHNYNCTAWRYQ